ncbi:hypothetical protein HELRODRAFT_170175 [Helobdella robusta]|uniref:GRIP domain-containing protein n=1 Tax=Helobdella robusta TaxID=6412 RepID=T1F2R0_HELRO|nr:hypothetical protein HELRODRAFT_170175 [Helobdella robusta]ESO07648.1 hypothetical protein HELRODRAFT_170175 [Helobdella robusta]
MERSKFDSFQRTIDEQNKKIETYKSKLKDVVQAYKDLMKEKEALEATVTTIKSLQQPQSATEANNAKSVHAEDNTENVSKVSACEKSNSDEIEESTSAATDAQSGTQNSDANIYQKIDVLTSSLLTVTQQKSKVEANFIAERKHFKQVLEDKEKEVNNLLEQIQRLEGSSSEWRKKLRQQQQEHEKQQNDCSLMMKELQTMINMQKIEIMRLDSQQHHIPNPCKKFILQHYIEAAICIQQRVLTHVEDVKLTSDEKQKSTTAYLNILENKEKSLKVELDEANKKLKETYIKLTEPTAKIAVLEQRVIEAEERESKQKKMDEKKIEELESKIKEISNLSERRVASLEESVRQLSESLGDVEKERRNDQLIIEKLKDRILKLDQENVALMNISKAVAKAVDNTDDDDNSDTTSSEELFNTVQSLVRKLKNRKFDLSALQDIVSNDQDLHLKCKQQYEQLQEDYERYKLRAQSVLKTKSKESNSDQELINLKRQMSEMREKQAKLIATIDSKEMLLNKKEESQINIINTLEAKHKNEISRINADHQQKVSDLEHEIRKQRDRTISMLADKDQEINELKMRISTPGNARSVKEVSPIPFINNSYANKFANVQETYSLPMDESSEVGASSATNEEPADFNYTHAIKELFSRSSFVSGNENTSSLLHFAQEKAKMEIEIANLRKQKHDVEQKARETFCELTLEKQEYQNKLSDMMEFVRKTERDNNRENANMEYLKNVVYQYIICKDGSSRHRMFNAISTILQFSPVEKQTVLSKKGWLLYQQNLHST